MAYWLVASAAAFISAYFAVLVLEPRVQNGTRPVVAATLGFKIDGIAFVTKRRPE